MLTCGRKNFKCSVKPLDEAEIKGGGRGSTDVVVLVGCAVCAGLFEMDILGDREVGEEGVKEGELSENDRVGDGGGL